MINIEVPFAIGQKVYVVDRAFDDELYNVYTEKVKGFIWDNNGEIEIVNWGLSTNYWKDVFGSIEVATEECNKRNNI